MILAARLMSLDQGAHKLFVKEIPAERALTQDILVNHRAIPPAKPRADGNGKAHLTALEYLCGEQLLHALSQNVFCRHPAQFHALRQARRIFDQLVIQKGHATLYGRGHAHLILLHQKLVKIGLRQADPAPAPRA